MIRVPSISSIYDSTGIPTLRVSLTHFASSLSILSNVPVRGLTFLRTFFVQTADLYISSLDIIVLNDFLSKVGRLNTFMTYLQVSDTTPTFLNFSMICNFSATGKRLVICFSAYCDAGSFLRTFFAGGLSLSFGCADEQVYLGGEDFPAVRWPWEHHRPARACVSELQDPEVP